MQQQPQIAGVEWQMSGASKDELSKLSVAELTQLYADGLRAAKASEHVGRHNRLVGQCWQIVQELKTRGAARAALSELTEHFDADVRGWAKSHLDGLDKSAPQAAAEPQPKGPYWQHIAWQCDHPPPPALTRDDDFRRQRSRPLRQGRENAVEPVGA